MGDEALGRSRGGLSTKLHVLADARGRPLHVLLGPGQQGDCRRAGELLAAVPRAGKVLADKAYDAKQVLAAVAALGAEAVIPVQGTRRRPRPLDRAAYRHRNAVERLIGRLKQFRRLATRYDKTASSYLGFVHFIGALMWLR